MKKFIVLLTVTALAFSSVSCSEKKDSSSEIIPETDNIEIQEDTAVFEQNTAAGGTDSAAVQHLSLTDDDFSDIEINLNVSDSLPFEVHEVSLSKLDFGEHLSPCKSQPEKYDRQNINFYDPEMQAEYEEERKKLYSTPYGGDIENIIAYNNKLYIAVNYDDMCMIHDSSLFCYDMLTGSLEEVISCNDLNDTANFGGMVLAGDMLIYPSFDYSDRNKSKLIAFYPETGEKKLLYTGDFDFCTEIGGNAAVCRYGSYSEKINDRTISYLVQDKDSGEFTELAEVDTEKYKLIPCGSGLAEVLYRGENKTSIVTADRYTVDTGLRLKSADTIIADDNSVIVFKEGGYAYTDDLVAYRYDLVNRERVRLDLEGLGSIVVPAGSNFIIGFSSFKTLSGYGEYEYGFGETPGAYSFVMPELGTAFNLGRTQSLFANSGNSYCMIAYNDDGSRSIKWFEVK